MSQGRSWDRVSGLLLLVCLLSPNFISVSRPCVYFRPISFPFPASVFTSAQFPPSHHTQVSLSNPFNVIKIKNMHAKNQIPRAFMRMGMPRDANMAPMNPPFWFFVSGMMADLLCVCTQFRARICLALSLDRSMDAYGFSLCKCWGRIIAHGVLFPRVRPFLRPPTIFLPRPSIAPRPKAGIIFVPSWGPTWWRVSQFLCHTAVAVSFYVSWRTV